ncbi:hypothetical protein NXH76_07220 [Blautia schinkii]|nr:hypothetical protein [Blautia schinkii]
MNMLQKEMEEKIKKVADNNRKLVLHHITPFLLEGFTCEITSNKNPKLQLQQKT